MEERKVVFKIQPDGKGILIITPDETVTFSGKAISAKHGNYSIWLRKIGKRREIMVINSKVSGSNRCEFTADHYSGVVSVELVLGVNPDEDIV